MDDIVKSLDALKGENLPMLDNMVNELLRVYSAQNVPRMCLKDTIVRGFDGEGRVKQWQFKKGDLLQLLFWNVHDAGLNPQVSSPPFTLIQEMTMKADKYIRCIVGTMAVVARGKGRRRKVSGSARDV